MREMRRILHYSCKDTKITSYRRDTSFVRSVIYCASPPFGVVLLVVVAYPWFIIFPHTNQRVKMAKSCSSPYVLGFEKSPSLKQKTNKKKLNTY